MEKPRFRHVAISPHQQDGRQHFVLTDPTGFAPQPMVVSPAVALILRMFDGAHDLEQIRTELFAQVGATVTREQLVELVRGLEQAGFLEGETFDSLRRARIEEYRTAPCRHATYAGSAYPAEGDELREWYDAVDCAGAAGSAATGRLVGLAAPHIDLRFGAASCKLVHQELARRRADVDTVVVLGTGHGAAEDLFILTHQDYATPLGPVSTDTELVEALANRVGRDELLGAEILHAQEHSVEFQALFLRLAAAADSPRLLPVLVGSFEPFVVSGEEPFCDSRVRRFIAGLEEEVDRLGRRVVYAASIDLSHMGPRYGDPRGLTPDEAARVEREDRELLAFAERGDAEGFFRHNQAAGDRRRVCGFSSLYTLLRLLPGARGRLLRYDQSTFPGTADTVAHCAMLFEQQP